MDQTTSGTAEGAVGGWVCTLCGHKNQEESERCMNCGSLRSAMAEHVEADLPGAASPAIPQAHVKSQYPIGRILAWLGLFALLVLIALVLLRNQEGPIVIGQKPPAFILTTFAGQQIGTDEMAGKVVLVNFWASWCKTCEQEAADLETAWQYYQPRGDVMFIGIAWTDTEQASLAYIKKFDISYPNGPDLGTVISQAYRITAVPETYIMDKQGKLASMKLSPYTSLAEIKAAIDPLLGP